METSRYFERTLFYDRSPTADGYYTRSAETLFEKDPRRSRIEVRVQSSIDVSFYDEKKPTTQAEPEEHVEEKAVGKIFREDASNHSPYEASTTAKDYPRKLKDAATPHFRKDEDTDSDDAWSLSSKASSTALPTALDQHRGSGPPSYPGPPKLTVVHLDSGNIQNFVKRTRHDFRVFYLRQRHSYSRLQVTRELCEQLLRCCHVFPRFNEYLIGFGLKNSESEVGPPPLNFRPLCESHSNSYRGFECSYILRYVEFTNRGGGKFPWSLRQFAVYHRYKPKSETGCNTFILVGASERTEVCIDRYTRSFNDLNGCNPFELHVLFLDTVIASWRPYLVDLAKLVTHQSNKAVGMDIGCNGEEEDFVSIEVEDHQELKQIEDQIADLILCLDSTLDTVSTFEDMYSQFRDQQDTSSKSPRRSAYGSDTMVFSLKRKAKEIALRRKQAKALLAKVQTTRTLISSLLERQSGHNLETLERQGQNENVIMRQLTEKNSRDSSSMRILTIITMIYLPCTIVSNFYSTQFVNQTDSPSGGKKLEYAQNAWLFFAISVPLTLLTILVWWLWVNSERILQIFSHRNIQDDDRPQDDDKPRRGRGFLRFRKSFVGLPQ